jgi:adenine-specific DNA methylase
LDHRNSDTADKAVRSAPEFPRTRYQGSKAKLIPWLREVFQQLDFESVLDAFGGTGSVSHMLKHEGKAVTYNDLLAANATFARGLIENDSVTLTEHQIETHLRFDASRPEPGFISDTFQGIYYTDEENEWLDEALRRLLAVSPDRFDYALLFFAIAQACIIKRPYNLFHRKNLYLRLAKVERSFGNKVAWDKPFPAWAAAFAREANGAVFEGRHPANVINGDACDIEGPFDLVYMDPPYLSKRGNGVDYRQFYHFLEGLAHHSDWPDLIDWNSKNRRFHKQPNDWSHPQRVLVKFEEVFDRHRRSTLAVSYRDDGTPSIEELRRLLQRHKNRVRVIEYGTYHYALSTNAKSKEVVLLAED